LQRLRDPAGRGSTLLVMDGPRARNERTAMRRCRRQSMASDRSHATEDLLRRLLRAARHEMA
jgi:hypothetical protein